MDSSDAKARSAASDVSDATGASGAEDVGTGHGAAAAPDKSSNNEGGGTDHRKGGTDAPEGASGTGGAENLGETTAADPTGDTGGGQGGVNTGMKSVSAAQEADGARAWDVSERLARLAVLVTGSPDRAYQLTRETLIAVGRDGPYVQARRKLLRRAVRMRVDQYAAGLLPGLGGLTPAARLWRRLMSLPAADRALIVLTEAEGMADAVAGAVLGLPRMETEKTLQRVRQVLEVQAQLTEAERREVFEGPALLPASSAVPTQALSRAQRSRRLWRGAVAAAVVVLAAGSLAFAVTRDSDKTSGPAQYDGLPVRLAEPAQWPARGDLLDDSGLLKNAVAQWHTRGLDAQGTTPTVVWAGRLGGSRRLVVLTGRDHRGDQVLGALLDSGHGPTLVDTQPAVRALAFGFSGLEEGAPQSRRFLVAPWVSELAVNDVVAAEPTTGDSFRTVVLRAGLSEPWVRGSAEAGCGRPVLRLAGTDPQAQPGGQPGAAGTSPSTSATPSGATGATGTAAPGGAGGDTDGTGSTPSLVEYALDVDDHSPTSGVDAPSGSAPARQAYLNALRGLAPCAATPVGGQSLTGGAEPFKVAITDLQVRGVWAGALPDRTSGQVFRASWRVVPVSGTATRNGQGYVLVAGGAASYSASRFSSDPVELDRTVSTVAWTSKAKRRSYTLLAAGPGVAGLDLSPRPRGFRPGRAPVLVINPPAPGRVSAVGLDGAGRPVATQPLDL